MWTKFSTHYYKQYYSKLLQVHVSHKLSAIVCARIIWRLKETPHEKMKSRIFLKT